jgi:hypothetical protein
VRFFVGRKGVIACRIRDIASTETWTLGDPVPAKALLEALERSRPKGPESLLDRRFRE